MQSSQILLKERLSTFFEIVSGVRQGCLLSSFLFLLVIDYVKRQRTGLGNTGIQWNLRSQLEDLDIKVNTRANDPIKVQNANIEEVLEFTYLGSVVAPGGGTEQDVKSRISKARGAFARLHKVWR